MRADWAAGWARALAPGGILVCLAFPIGGKDGVETGPPWPVQVHQYKDVLLPLGFTLEKEEAVPDHLSHPGRGGKEALLVFRRA